MKPNISLSLSKLLTLQDYQLSSDFPDTITVDDQSLEILLQIEKDLSVFKAMGSDDNRMLLIKARRAEGLIEEFSNTWFWFSSQHYQDYHALYISNNAGFFIRICNKLHMTQDTEEVKLRHNLVEQLQHFRQCLLLTINWILSDNGKEYRAWMKRCMPKELRTGIISRQRYNAITGKNDKRSNLKKIEAEVKSIISRAHPIRFQRMTLEIYIQYWSLCYRLLEGKKYLKGRSDKELFFEYNNCGSKSKDYDLKSEEGFRKWKREQAEPYHGFDLYYVTVHLYPWKNEDGTWELDFRFSECYWEEALKLIIALDKQHIHLSSYEELLPRLNEEDILFVTTSRRVPNHYYDQLDEEIEIGGPHIHIDEVRPVHLQKVIKATRWLEEPYPTVANPEDTTSEEKDEVKS